MWVQQVSPDKRPVFLNLGDADPDDNKDLCPYWLYRALVRTWAFFHSEMEREWILPSGRWEVSWENDVI